MPPKENCLVDINRVKKSRNSWLIETWLKEQNYLVDRNMA